MYKVSAICSWGKSSFSTTTSSACWVSALLALQKSLERCLRGAHRLHHVLGATSTFLQISSWWRNTCPVFFPQIREWLNSEINVKEMEASASQKWWNQRNSDRKKAIYFCIKSVIYSTDFFFLQFNLLDEYGTICYKYGYWFGKLPWTNSLCDSEFWLYWVFWQCKDLGYISRKLMSYSDVLPQIARNCPEGSAGSN